MKGAIDMTYVVKQKYTRLQAICSLTSCVLYFLAGLCLGCGLFRPIFVDTVTVWSVWLSMILEALAYGLYRVARWVKRAAL